MFTSAIKGKTGCTLDVVSLKNARFVTIWAWNSFTISWYVQRAKFVTYEQGEVMFCVSDVFAKVFLTLILVNATLEESMTSKAKRMEAIAVQIREQMAQADKLLESLMPASVVKAMKSGKAVSAEEFAAVTVICSDIHDFAKISGTHSSKDNLAMLKKLWTEYDIICKRWSVSKVQVTNDAFLGVVGAPDRVSDHAERAVNFALDVLKMVADFAGDHGQEIQVRIGINTGPVTAGFVTDRWHVVGDAVDVASRLQSTSRPQGIRISDSTHRHINGKGYKVEGPEKINLSGKEDLNTYWLQGRVQYF
ncbi:nucleotide cyclase [Chytriomyces sp. MP71]|nr:nucleotide cyclase [Chytriomyces sp. MP71]